MRISKDLLEKRFRDSRETYAQSAKIQQKMRLELLKILQNYAQNDLGNVLELGCGAGDLSYKIARKYVFNNYIALDLVDFTQEFLKIKNLLSCNVTFMQGDFEKIEQFGFKNIDYILSNAALQWCNQGALLPKFANILKRDGILAFSTFGKENFKELRAMFNVGLEYLGLSDYAEILRDFEILEFVEKKICLDFKNPYALFKHLQNTGVNALNKDFRLTKSHLKDYEKRFCNILTYHLIFLLARRI